MFKIWCEWDIGNDGAVFKTKQAALDWLLDNAELKEAASYEEIGEGKDYRDLSDFIENSGLVSINKQEVYG
jgi:hypothetical protein